MTIDVFANEVRDAVYDKMNGYEVFIQNVTKMNDVKLHGLVIKSPDSEVSPTIYLENYFEDYANGESIEPIVSDIIDTYYEHTSCDAPHVNDANLEWDSVKDNITMRLIGTDRNKEYLEGKVHLDIADGLSVIFDINVYDNGEGEYTLAVTEELSHLYGYEDAADLYIRAFDSNASLDKPVLMDMTAALFNPNKENLLERDGVANGDMYVLTTESQVNGAKALYYKGIMKKVSNIVDGNYFVLPSSVHEVIVVPDHGIHDASDFIGMVKTANQCVVDEADVLADAVYYYSNNGLKRVA